MDAMKNTKWDERFLKMAEDVATWSSCYQSNRQVGAVIAKNKRILTTGYNGASAGILSCKDRGYCLRKKLGIESGTALPGQLFCQLLPQAGRCFFFGKAHTVQKALYI